MQERPESGMRVEVQWGYGRTKTGMRNQFHLEMLKNCRSRYVNMQASQVSVDVMK